jgi:hypothetical protein
VELSSSEYRCTCSSAQAHYVTKSAYEAMVSIYACLAEGTTNEAKADAGYCCSHDQVQRRQGVGCFLVNAGKFRNALGLSELHLILGCITEAASLVSSGCLPMQLSDFAHRT